MADKWIEYARSRKQMRYYSVVADEILRCEGESILDVGCGGTELVGNGSFSIRHAVNLEPIDDYPYPLTVGRWPDVELPLATYDVVLCCQVLEHLETVSIEPFVKRLLATDSKTLIVSVPYRWPAGSCEHHLQDPVDEEKLRSWIGREPTRSTIVDDSGVRRLVASYDMLITNS